MERKSLAACNEATIAQSAPTTSQAMGAARGEPGRGEIPMQT